VGHGRRKVGRLEDGEWTAAGPVGQADVAVSDRGTGTPVEICLALGPEPAVIDRPPMAQDRVVNRIDRTEILVVGPDALDLQVGRRLRAPRRAGEARDGHARDDP
jgi:hypothetical protein